jgi:hypothetical protein
MVVVHLSLLVSGCGGTDTDPVTIEGPLIVDADAPTDGLALDAEVSGQVALVSGCVALTDPTGAATVGVKWPPGTTWDEASDAVVLADGRRVRIGDSITGGGGYFGADEGRLVTSEARWMLEECGLDSVAFLDFDPAWLEIDATS